MSCSRKRVRKGDFGMNVLKWIGLLLACTLAAACTEEDFKAGNGLFPGGEDATTFIRMDCGGMPAVDMNSRGSGSDVFLGDLENLNIRVHRKDGSRTDFYCHGSSIDCNGKPAGAAAEYVGGKDLAQFGTGGTVFLHLSDIRSTDVARVEVLANSGRDLHGTGDWGTVREREADGLLERQLCMMYGATDRPQESTHTDPETGRPCALYAVSLKRTRALLSICLDGSALDEGVEITPYAIRLRNVPYGCAPQRLGDALRPNRINSPEESCDTAQEMTLHNKTLKRGRLLGAHAKPEQPLPKDFLPLFLFENRQGTWENAGNTDRTKYPPGVNSVAEAKDRKRNYPYSFVEIEAYYIYRTGRMVKNSGRIVYRFFLGRNAHDNFDVEGNHYYRLTLKLKGLGGAKEDGKTDAEGHLAVNDKDLSWRVDLKIKDWGFDKNQYDFDSHACLSAIDVIGKNWMFEKVLKGDGYASWLMININDKYNVNWANPTTIIHEKYPLKIENGKLKISIQPMFYAKGMPLDPTGAFDEKSYLKQPNYREMVLVIKNTDTHELDTITLRQYVPIPVQLPSSRQTVFMERFEDYEQEEVYGYPWRYAGNKLDRLKDMNGMRVSYHYGTAPSKEKVGLNATYLKDDAASASAHCYRKGLLINGIEGASADYYALPSQEMMKAMMEMAETYDPKTWGPFEPIHRFEDYWTSSVPEGQKTETVFFNGEIHHFEQTADRELYKRIRAVYTHHQW